MSGRLTGGGCSGSGRRLLFLLLWFASGVIGIGVGVDDSRDPIFTWEKGLDDRSSEQAYEA